MGSEGLHHFAPVGDEMHVAFDGRVALAKRLSVVDMRRRRLQRLCRSLRGARQGRPESHATPSASRGRASLPPRRAAASPLPSGSSRTGCNSSRSSCCRRRQMRQAGRLRESESSARSDKRFIRSVPHPGEGRAQAGQKTCPSNPSQYRTFVGAIAIKIAFIIKCCCNEAVQLVAASSTPEPTIVLFSFAAELDREFVQSNFDKKVPRGVTSDIIHHPRRNVWLLLYFIARSLTGAAAASGRGCS